MGVKPSAATVDQRRSTCKICRYGIYAGQATAWSQRPLGLVHTECAPKGAGR